MYKFKVGGNIYYIKNGKIIPTTISKINQNNIETFDKKQFSLADLGHAFFTDFRAAEAMQKYNKSMSQNIEKST